MKISIKSFTFLLGLILLGLYWSFAIYYLSHSRSQLLQDYLQQHSPFYRQAIFEQDIFTDALKRQANLFCILGMAFSVLLLFWFRCFDVQLVREKIIQHFRSCNSSVYWLLALIALCVVLWVFMNAQSPLCTDEAFSALNFAQQPVAHLLSYYPVPNNHIFFNLLNHFAGKIVGDYVLSGRLLSGIFYTLLLCSQFFFIRRFTKSNFLAFLVCVLLAQQFMIWGFAAQARGYALYYLLQWYAFVALYDYFFVVEWKNKKLLLLALLFCNVLGVWTIPSFLYFMTFEGLVALVIMLKQKQLHIAFWQMMLLSVCAILWVYTPVFCYSGFSSVFLNKYVAALPLNVTEVAVLWAHYMANDVSIMSFSFAPMFQYWAISFFVLPLILLLIFHKQLSAISSLTYLGILIWIAVLALVLLMKQVPFFRAIGFQMQLSLLIFSVLCIVLWNNLFRNILWGKLLFSALIIWASIIGYQYNQSIIATHLYGQNTKAFYLSITAKPLNLGKDARVWISDESYMWNFLLKQKQSITNYDAAFDNQEVLILSEDDKPIPKLDLTKYEFKEKVSWFSIYQKRDTR